jgi:fatty-acyl-CoA synthase
MLELHHFVPARGAALVPINVRLSSDEIVYILEHSGASLLVATHEFAEIARSSARRLGTRVLIAGGDEDEYEGWLSAAPSDPGDACAVADEQLIAINYTSGTTGRPKGVMYHHRGAYLQALAMAYHLRLGPGARYLWTLPMFHCDGWCLTWAVTAAGGTHVCLRTVDPAEVWKHLSSGRISHLSAAPTVLTLIAEHPSAVVMPQRVRVSTGGSPPSPALLARLEPLGMDVTHLYGLTETFGPIAVSEWQPEWDSQGQFEASRLRARQGIGNIVAAPLRVLDDEGRDVPADGETIGELAVHGNNVMLGYYRDETATAGVSRSGCFLTGDLAVKHPDGYVEIRDRRKDIIITGGENVASVEIERTIDAHESVVESAVVGMPDPVWGEIPVAFVTVREGATLTAANVIEHVRAHLARFKSPRRVIFTALPKTSTGKIQKNVLRAQVRRPGV